MTPRRPIAAAVAPLAPVLPSRESESHLSSPLLSLDVSAREACRLQGWSDTDQARLGDMIGTTLGEWGASWGLSSQGRAASGPRREFEIKSISIAAAEAGWTDFRWESMSPQRELNEVWWASWTLDGTAHVSRTSDASKLRDPGKAPKALYLTMFGETSSSSGGSGLAEELTHTAWLDWCGRLAALALPEEEAARAATSPMRSGGPGQSVANGFGVPAEILKPWSGALVLSVPWCEQTILLLMSPEYVAAVLRRARGEPSSPGGPSQRRPAPLVPLLRAVSAKSLSLRVELAEMEVGLGALTALRPGDILHTTHRLEAPLLITSPDSPGQPNRSLIFTGFLGKKGEERAVELLPHENGPAEERGRA